MSLNAKIDLKWCIHPPFQNSTSVFTESQWKLAYASDVSHYMYQLSQSSLSGARTLVVRNTMAVQVSGLELLVAYKLFATRLWNSTIFSWSSFLQS